MPNQPTQVSKQSTSPHHHTRFSAALAVPLTSSSLKDLPYMWLNRWRCRSCRLVSDNNNNNLVVSLHACEGVGGGVAIIAFWVVLWLFGRGAETSME
ncbi:uncharacterized protein MYCFIDRAFT_176912 [Pseudocercospora fijiensis CIRAD86]|uniref:Uncharacterized protein n=1 Tax=Pseudocercospora fijiensis (strain CIRAD86) TaxID=383855 RepID=M3A5L8_PSEFD|nr:uncharacterized protein MYCFIDRAFT_176912 [Pseudocercospora fijiensis CIRAD86]EME79911.1 hypothetical protein MYCFIDRAFT_176912 [Pseudocercospora fijiensis CIRAD86]